MNHERGGRRAILYIVLTEQLYEGGWLRCLCHGCGAHTSSGMTLTEEESCRSLPMFLSSLTLAH